MPFEAPAPPPGGTYRFVTSPGLATWLVEQRVSLAFALPPAKLVLVGTTPAGELAIFERSFDKVMGLSADGDGLWLGCRNEVWRLAARPPQAAGAEAGHDQCFTPREVFATGPMNIHDLHVGADGRPVWVNTRFGCLAGVDERASFVPRWIPPWLTGLASADRCHLNGLAMVDGHPGFVSSVSTSDEVAGWREHRRDGGVIARVPDGEIVAAGLSMPHSPRWHDGAVWFTESGTGHLRRLDPMTGDLDEVVFGPGFLRGLALHGDWAVAGCSRPRRGDVYSGLALDDNLAAAGIAPRLGLVVVDLRAGAIAHWLFVEGPSREVFDVAVLPGIRRPMALGLNRADLEAQVWFDSRALAVGP